MPAFIKHHPKDIGEQKHTQHKPSVVNKKPEFGLFFWNS
jgi:hypothetical protein